MNDKTKVKLIKKLLDDAFEAQWEGEMAWYMLANIILTIVTTEEE